MGKNIIVYLLGLVIFVLITTIIVLQRSVDEIELAPVGPEGKLCQQTCEFPDTATVQRYTDILKNALAGSDKPLVIFDPTISSDEEKEEVLTKIIYPYDDYRNDTSHKIELRAKAYIVHKHTTREIGETANSTYRIDIIGNDGQLAGETEGVVGKPLGYWIPGCLSECKFTPAYRKKFPEVVAEYFRITKGQ